MDLFRSSVMYFSDVLSFLAYRSYATFQNLLLCFLVFLRAVIHEIIFLISFLEYSLVVYRNITDFFVYYIFILQPATLLELIY